MKQIDFTKGKIIKSLVVFAIPILLGETLQNLYNTVDTIIVGNFTGQEALAAVSICNVASKLIVALFSGISVGAGVVISKAFGRGNKEELKRDIQSLISFSLILGVAVSILGVLFSKSLIEITNARADYYDQAVMYLRIIFAGTVFTCVYNFIAGALRAIGDSAVTLKILAVTAATNAILDYIFVRYFEWGVAGAAIATVTAEAVSVTMGFVVLRRRIEDKVLNFTKMYYYGRDAIVSSLRIGISVGIQSAVLQISNMIVMRYANMFSTASVAGISTAQRLDNFASLPITSLSTAVSTGIAQNIGAGKYERVKPIVKLGMLISLAATAIVSVLLYLFSSQLVALFNADPEVISSGTAMMHALVPFYVLMCVRHILAASIRPYNKSFVPAIIVIVGMVVIRQTYLAIGMGINESLTTFFYCYPVGWAASLLPMVIYYCKVRKQLRGLRKPAAKAA